MWNTGTATAAGSTSPTRRINEISLADTVIPATGAHVWGEYRYDEAGHSQTCTVCGEVRNEAHTLTETILQEATYYEEGSKKLECVCGYSRIETIPMLSYETGSEATVRGVSLTLNGTINANAYITIPDALVEAGLWAELDGSAAKIELSDKLSSGAYRFTVERAAKNMNTQTAIRLLDETGSPIKLVNESGTEYEADTFRFCVQDYLQTVIRNPGRFDAKLVALCKAMSDYGHYAQIALKFENENGKIWPEVYHTAEDFAAVHPTDASSTEVKGTGVSYYGASVILRSETRIRAYFRIEGDAAGAKATVDGSPAELRHYGSGSYYYVDVADIHAKDLGQIHTICVQLGDNSATLSNYSAYSYAARVLNRAAADQADADLANAVRALWRYGQAAETYFQD